MPIISVPKPLRDKLGDEGSDALVAMLNEQGKETENSVIQTVELRFEKKLTEEISGLREEMIRGNAGVLVSIQKSKADTIKWMFIFWVGQIGALVGILFAVFK